MKIELEKNNGIATIRISRQEKHNSLTLKMYQELGEAFCQIRDDCDIRVAVLTGEGEKAFCVGADLYESIPALANGNFDISYWDKAHLKNLKLYKPVIAAVRGMCFGGGFEILLATDIRVASQDAVFQFPEPKHGFVPAGGTLVRLVRQIGYAPAMQLLLTAKRFYPEHLLKIGVLNEVVENEKVLDRAYEIAEEIATLSPLAIQTIKEAALTLQDLPLELAFEREASLGQKTFESDDAKQGLDIFANRK